MKYEVKAYTQSVTIDKVWFQVEAGSEEEAKQKVLKGNADYDESKTIDVISEEFIDTEHWEYKKL